MIVRITRRKRPLDINLSKRAFLSSHTTPPNDNSSFVLWNERVVFPGGVVQPGSVQVDANKGTIVECVVGESAATARQRAQRHNRQFVNLQQSVPKGGGRTVLAPGLIDVHTHISALGRNWEGYSTATKAAAAGGITTIMSMPLNSLPPTTTISAVEQECQAAQSANLWSDVGLWGGVIPSSMEGEEDNLVNVIQSPYVFGLKAFLAPLPPAAGYAAVTPQQLRFAATVCGPRNKPILVHSELMTEQEVKEQTEEAFDAVSHMVEQPQSTTTATIYAAHIHSRPTEWEQRAVQVVCDLANDCAMHIVHLSDSGCLPMIAERKRDATARLTVETCPHYLLFDSASIAADATNDDNENHNDNVVDTRFKCFPPIRDETNRNELWQNGMETNLIDMLASDHSPCESDMRLRDSGDLQRAWGGLSGLQYQLPASWHAATELASQTQKTDEQLLSDMTRWWSTAPSELIPGLAQRKGQIEKGFQADVVWWDIDSIAAPNSYSKEHHRWKGDTCYADRRLRGRVLGTWLGGQQVYNGLTDTHTNPVGRLLSTERGAV